ncbi:WxcM-like domain-containing protein [Flavobacterium cucumis]|uniref:WxcM-like, C-terminal n=1 Tax=Flavobacterium cucumis TaxID=416016 RepID=A0A1M7ZWW6_9FLAO|nr:WxcM-like domain-containing protein [Flavobacterium cucumis]SHO73300.1 WxcM-like, C-terminal [Flavobacterium cucumis]
MIPKLIPGGSHSDIRGTLTFNNDFDATSIKRMYTIENADVYSIRGWQGHKIEQRWFSAINGTFKIQILSIDYFEKGLKDLKPYCFVLKADKMDILHVPAGFVSSIQAQEVGAKLLVLADYKVGEVDDEFRFEYHPDDFLTIE